MRSRDRVYAVRSAQEGPARFPFLSAAEVDEIASASRALRADRERSLYGDEELELPPGSLFGERDARSAHRSAKRVVEMVERAFPPPPEEGAPAGPA